MSDDNAAAKNRNRRIAEELAEAEANKYQLALDRWWQAQRDFEEEWDDSYMVGGFMERWSQTPSFSKSRRDRDWKVR
jgi:hypothetical protein